MHYQVQLPILFERLHLFSQMIHFSLNYLIYSYILYFSSFAPLLSSSQYQGYSQQFVSPSGIPASLFLPDGTLYRLFSFLISIYGILHSTTSCLGLFFPATVRTLALQLYESESLLDVLQRIFCCIRIFDKPHKPFLFWNNC